MIYEVFRQERKGQAFQHAGSVDAPDEQFAADGLGGLLLHDKGQRASARRLN